MKLYATCDSANYDEATAVCSEVVFVEDGSGWLPDLPRETGAELGAAIFGLFAVAYLLRKVRGRH
jgi:hypothetical protein